MSPSIYHLILANVNFAQNGSMFTKVLWQGFHFTISVIHCIFIPFTVEKRIMDITVHGSILQDICQKFESWKSVSETCILLMLFSANDCFCVGFF